jgi:hypothetical protein
MEINEKVNEESNSNESKSNMIEDMSNIYTCKKKFFTTFLYKKPEFLGEGETETICIRPFGFVDVCTSKFDLENNFLLERIISYKNNKQISVYNRFSFFSKNENDDMNMIFTSSQKFDEDNKLVESEAFIFNELAFNEEILPKLLTKEGKDFLNFSI